MCCVDEAVLTGDVIVDVIAGTYTLVVMSTACIMSLLVVSIGLAVTGR